MYCKNCGMKLPDWAHFCERCGARVGTDNAHADPIDLVGLDDTSASEPLWVVEDDAPGQPDAAAVERAASHMASNETELMDPAEVESYGNHAAPAAPASEGPLGPNGTELMEPLDATDPDGTQLMDAEDEVLDEEPELEAAGEGGSSKHSAEDTEQDTDAEAASDAADAGDIDPDEAADSDPDSDAAEAADEDSNPDEAAAESPDTTDPDADPAPDPNVFPYWQGASYNTYGESPVYMGDLAEDPDADSDEPRPVGMNSAMRHRTDAEWRQRQQQAGKIGGKSSIAAMLAPLAIAAIALVAGYFLLNGLIEAVRTASPSIEETTQPTKSKRVSRGEARKIIEGLEGWWNTGRTFDGRYWHIEKGVLYTFAADGEMVNEEKIDETSVEHMDAGPGGIEGKGYYFRSVALYQLEDDTDTLYKIEQDGSANEDANLHRTKEPNFDEEPPEEEKKEEDPYAKDFILPDSSTRIYDRAELDRLNNYDLWIAYNEIYARVGYKFNPEGELGKRFYAMEWYKPRDDFQWEDFNEVERENTNTMYALEQERGSEYLY